MLDDQRHCGNFLSSAGEDRPAPGGMVQGWWQNRFGAGERLHVVKIGYSMQITVDGRQSHDAGW